MLKTINVQNDLQEYFKDLSCIISILQMHHITTLIVVILSMCLFAQMSICCSRAITDKKSTKDLLANSEKQTRDLIKTIISDKTPVEIGKSYSCFPWIFNPGNYDVLMYIHVSI